MARKSRKVTVDIPLRLYEETEQAVSNLNTTISVFIRESISRRLRSIQRANLERELKEGYIANAGLGDQVCKEFQFADGETAGQIDA